MRVAIDTNRLTDLFRGDHQLAEFLGGCEEVHVPLNVIGELKAGFLGGSRWPQNERALTALLQKQTVDVILPTRATADHYARLYVQLRTAGTPIPINGLWIAAQCLEHDLPLITRDSHFKKVPQLLLIKP